MRVNTPKAYAAGSDLDPADIVFFPNFFRFIEQDEEELFRAAGTARNELLDANRAWMPRVEAFAKFLSPIRNGTAIRVRMTPTMKGLKTVRYDFEILDDSSNTKLCEGYIAMVCVEREDFKSTPLPIPIRKAIMRGGRSSTGVLH